MTGRSRTKNLHAKNKNKEKDQQIHLEKKMPVRRDFGMLLQTAFARFLNWFFYAL